MCLTACGTLPDEANEDLSLDMNRKLRLFYAAVAGDVIGSYRCWRDGRDDPSQVAVTYSSQFWDVCRSLDADSFAVSSHRGADTLTDGRFRVENRPKPAGDFRGVAYHAALKCGTALRLWRRFCASARISRSSRMELTQS